MTSKFFTYLLQIRLDDLEEKTSGIKRQKLNEIQQFSKKRPGGVRHGDAPKLIKNVILIEGEVYWEVEWINVNAVNETLEDSYERQSALVQWNSLKFNELKDAYI